MIDLSSSEKIELSEMLFMLLSGEHPTLPSAEVQAILESKGIKFQVLDSSPRMQRIEAPDEVCSLLQQRSAYINFCGVELMSCQASELEIFKLARNVSYSDFITPELSFAVRVKEIDVPQSELNIPSLEKKLGEIILDEVEGLHVNLKNPDRLFIGLIAKRKFVFGFLRGLPERKNFGKRTPRRKPFFHPSSLQPKLARCMINLSRTPEGKIILDPFCGTGTVLIEAELIGFESIGVDISRKMVRGAKRNLEHYGVENLGLCVSDALHLPFSDVNSIVTDPPYGRAASTVGLSAHTLVKEFLKAAGNIIPSGGFVCMSTPKTLSAYRLAEDYGFKVHETHSLYVHKNLTREIAVLKVE